MIVHADDFRESEDPSGSLAPPCRHLAPYMGPCEDHGDDAWACPDILFMRLREGGYGIPVRDGGTSFVRISHCPFCGERLDAPAAEPGDDEDGEDD